MPPEGIHIPALSTLILSISFLSSGAQSSVLDPRSSDKPVTGGPLNDKTYIPAQVGGIVGAYALALVLVAILLIVLSKTRRDHLTNGNEEADFDTKKIPVQPGFALPVNGTGFNSLNIVTEDLNAQKHDGLKTPATPSPWTSPSPVSSLGAPGVHPYVDQGRVTEDKIMAQSQLEEMYKHVLEHEDAKKRGIAYDVPALPTPSHQSMRSPNSVSSLKSSRKAKPAGLNLRDEEKPQSRTSSLLSALRSPGRKKAMKAVNISSPIMTPQSATFPRQESQEMSTIIPRHYAPAPPPPCPPDQVNFGAVRTKPSASTLDEVSPESTLSIDERIGSQLPSHGRSESHAHTEGEPTSATSEHSQSALVGLPTSPKPGARFPSLPASPKPGQGFDRSTPPSAIRSGGNLPLRAYEQPISSPSIQGQTKQTVFERRGPLSPGGGMTPFTATAVPYSPYQPFTPCVPMTPSLVTKEERKRMRRMVPKTPTLAMVKSDEEVW